MCDILLMNYHNDLYPKLSDHLMPLMLFYRLTAWTLRLLKAATYPDWEFLLYVDPTIAERGIAWLLLYQNANGSFYDESPTLDSKLNTQVM